MYLVKPFSARPFRVSNQYKGGGASIFCGISIYHPYKTIMEHQNPKKESTSMKTFQIRANQNSEVELKYNLFAIRKSDIRDFGWTPK